MQVVVGVSGQLSLIDLESDGSGVSGQVTEEVTAGLAGDRAGLGRRPGADNRRRLESEIAGLLEDGEWRTSAEIGQSVGMRKQDATDALKASPHLFRCEPGGLHRRKHNARLWQLAVDTGAATTLAAQRPGKEQA